MNARVRLGMLVPSSNTVLEPVTTAMLAGLPEVSVHFSRFPVTEISLRENALKQFGHAALLHAAELLAHAKVDVIAWNGTSAGWLGFDTDERLCTLLKEATGIQTCTSVLALNEILTQTHAKRLSLVTPYSAEVHSRIASNYQRTGFEIVSGEHLGIEDNFSFSQVQTDCLATMVRKVAQAKPQAILVFCTNLRGAQIAEKLETETGIPVYDTVATALWKSLKTANVDPRRVKGWGSLFRDLV